MTGEKAGEGRKTARLKTQDMRTAAALRGPISDFSISETLLSELGAFAVQPLHPPSSIGCSNIVPFGLFVVS